MIQIRKEEHQKKQKEKKLKVYKVNTHKKTYNAGTYITHVGLYVGNNRMYHAGNPIGYTDLTGSYWQQHLAGAGRIKQ